MFYLITVYCITSQLIH